MVTALWKTSKANASTELIYTYFTYLRCTPSSGFGQTSFCCRCVVSDQKVNAAKHLLLSLALLFYLAVIQRIGSSTLHGELSSPPVSD